MPVLGQILGAAGSKLLGGLIDNFIFDPIAQGREEKLLTKQLQSFNDPAIQQFRAQQAAVQKQLFDTINAGGDISGIALPTLPEQLSGLFLGNPQLASSFGNSIAGDSQLTKSILGLAEQKGKNRNAVLRDSAAAVGEATLNPSLGIGLFDDPASVPRSDVLEQRRETSEASVFGTSEQQRKAQEFDLQNRIPINKEKNEIAIERNRINQQRVENEKSRIQQKGSDFQVIDDNGDIVKGERGKPSKAEDIMSQLFTTDPSFFVEDAATGRMVLKPQFKGLMKNFVRKVQANQRLNKNVDMPLAVDTTLEQMRRNAGIQGPPRSGSSVPGQRTGTGEAPSGQRPAITREQRMDELINQGLSDEEIAETLSSEGL